MDDKEIEEVAYLVAIEYGQSNTMPHIVDAVKQQLPDDWHEFFTYDVLMAMVMSIDAYIDLN